MPKKLALTYVSDNVNMCAFMLNKRNPDHLYQRISMPVLAKDFPRWSAIQWLTVLNLLIYYSLLLTAIACLLKSKKGIFLPVCIIAVGTLMLLLVGHGEARFHQPLMPFIIMLAARIIKI